MRLQIGQIRFFPAFLDAGEGELHAADVRQHLEMFFAQPIAQIAGDAVKQRIAAGDNDDSLRPAGRSARWASRMRTTSCKSGPIRSRSAVKSGDGA